MAIDTSFYNNQQLQQAPDLIGMATRAEQLKNMRMLNQENEAKRSLAAQDANEQKLMSDILKRNSSVGDDGKLRLNQGAAMSEMAGKVNPQRAMEFQKQIGQYNDSQLSNLLDVSEKGYRLALSNPSAWPQVRQTMIDNGVPNAQQLPEQYDENIIKRGLMGAQAYKEQQAQKISQQQADLAQQKADQDQSYRSKELSLKERELLDKQSERQTKRMDDEKNLPQNVYQAAVYGKRIEDANKQMSDLINGGYDPTSLTQAAKNKYLPEVLKSQDTKLMDQAQRNFINAVLRRESGSAISQSEFDSANKQYFPQVGDSKDVLAQKERNREVALAGMKTEGKKAWGRLENNLETSSPNSVKAGAIDSGYVFMGGDPSNQKNWKKVK